MKTRERSYTRLTAKRRDAFLANLAACGNVTAAADAIGVTRIALYKLKDRDASFDEAWGLALDRYAASLEAELHTRVFDGLQRPVFQRGELVGHETLKSDRLLEIALRARIPEKYSERLAAKIDHSGAAGVLVVPGALSMDEWLAKFVPERSQTDAENGA